MNTLQEALIGVFAESQWHYEAVDDGRSYRATYQGERGIWQVVFVLEGEVAGKVVSLFPCLIPKGRKPECAELLHRLNYGQKAGCYEMDMDEGQVRFRSALFRAQEGFTSEIVGAAIAYNLKTVDDNLPTILRVVYGGKTAGEALRTATEDDSAPRIRFELN